MTVDFQQIIDTAASRLERDANVVIGPAARAVLVSRAEANAGGLAEAMERQGLTPETLVDAAERQLREALPHIPPPQQEQQQQQQQQYQWDIAAPPPPPRFVSAAAVQAGTKSKCWFVLWC